MFQFLGRFTARYSVPIIIFWIVLAVALIATAPVLEEVTTDDNEEFLPPDSASIVAQALLEENFPQFTSAGAIVIVLDTHEPNGIEEPENRAFMDDLSRWLAGDEGPEGIASVDSISLNPQAADALLAPNGQVAMVIANLERSITEQDDQTAVLEAIEPQLTDAPDGMDIYQTGQIANLRDYTQTIETDISSTFVVLLALIVIILLVIFRSPVSPLIPLIIVFIALAITRAVVAIIGENFLTVSNIATTLLNTVVFGAGTDYAIFLISRFREELNKDGNTENATRNTVRFVGEAITSSAATTTTGFLAMAFTQVGLFNVTGPMLAVSIGVTLTAVLFLTPAVLMLLGERAFWPPRFTPIIGEENAFFERLAGLIRQYPWAFVGVIGTISVVAAIYGTGYQVTFDLFAELPEETESVAGFRILEDNIGAGRMQPTTALAEVDADNSYAEIEEITAALAAIDGVASVSSGVQPLGPDDTQLINITRLDVQLTTLAMITAPPTEDAEPPTEEQQMAFGEMLADLSPYLAFAAEAVPNLAQQESYTVVLDLLENSQQEEDFLPELSANLQTLAETAEPVHIGFNELPSGVYGILGGDQVSGVLASFLNDETHVARFQVILDGGPYDSESLDTLGVINETLDDFSDNTGSTGATAISADLRDAIASDLQLTIVLVMTGIFIVLVIMLRSLVAPLYLVATIMVSYGATLGATRIASDILFGQPELAFWVPFMIFVFLVALGIDYSILLFGRIREEAEKAPSMSEAIRISVGSTGIIIVSAAAIVSGSFFALMTGRIVGLGQVGFAVGYGILVDAVVIRAMLVPALAILFGRWSWWPGRLFHKFSQSSEPTGTGTD